MDKVVRIVLLGLFVLEIALAVPVDRLNKIDPIEDDGEYGDYFEGDMILTDEQKEYLSSETYNGKIATKYRWTNRTIPYQLTSDHSKDQHYYIKRALKVIESVSCVKFVPRTDQTDFIEVIDEGHGCSSHVGRHGGRQKLKLRSNKLGKGCFRLGTIIHEFLHALGFHHMQNTYDRDDYVTIQWDNIRPGSEHNFRKQSSSVVTNFNQTYDYHSVMHYSAWGFSINDEPTIIPTDDKYLEVIGQRKGLSKIDIIKLNTMYECDELKDDEVQRN